MLALKVIYAANVLVAGWVGISCLFFPRTAVATVFGNALEFSEGLRLVGALWSAIAVLSIVGLFFPQRMVPVLLLQLLYKGGWLLVAALPAIISNATYPKAMAGFFVVWVLVLPFVVPWGHLFR